MVQGLLKALGPLGDARFWQMLMFGSVSVFITIFVLPAVFLSVVQFSIEPFALTIFGGFFFLIAFSLMIIPVAVFSAPIFGVVFNWQIRSGSVERRAAVWAAIICAIVPSVVFYILLEAMEAFTNMRAKFELALNYENIAASVVVLIASIVSAPFAARHAFR